MDINAIIAAAGDEMLQQSHANTEQAFAVEEVSEEQPTVSDQPIDMWQNRLNAQRDTTPTAVYGARPKMQLDLTDLIQHGPIKDAYRKTVDDSERLRAEGETQRAGLIEQQYMQDYFYPTVDALIRMNSMEELLASQDVLEALDAMAIVPGGGRADGYTSVYVSSLYEPAGNTFKSDAQVRDAVRRIEALCGRNQIRQAGTLARRVQEKIDTGQNVALPEDYEIIQKVALRTA